MSSRSADVVKVVKFTPASIDALPSLTEAAIARAIQNTKARMADINAAYVPVRTGRLKRSFDIAFTPKHIAMEWDPIDPKSGFHYAEVVELGRTGIRPFPGRYYAEAIKWEAKLILEEELLKELSLIRP